MGVALLSVADKTGIVELARQLVGQGHTILSTGGTAKKLQEAGVQVTLVEEYTGSPEMLQGRVKTLHPKIHAGILARRGRDEKELEEHRILPIDIVAVNLYPFEQTVEGDHKLEEAIEQIDIGGVTLLRAAAKNYRDVTVLCDPADYPRLESSEELRKELAVKAFRHTMRYDSAIQRYLGGELLGERTLDLHLAHGEELRYGENPHQQATFYRDGTSGMGSAEQLHGKRLSYNNYLDGDAALQAMLELAAEPAAVVVKHLNPCGMATGDSLREALERAWAGDVVSAFGSVIAFSQEVDLRTAEFLQGKFVEMVIAPGYTDEALAFLKGKSKKLRILGLDGLEISPGTQYRRVSGGILEQTPDTDLAAQWECVTKTPFPEGKEALARFTLAACKHTKSNAVILGHEYKRGRFMVLGMGAGQPNRVDSLRKLAVTKAEENIEREYGDGKKDEILSSAMLASDAFFPFDDTVREAAAYGIRYIVQPGGSIRDEEVIEACDELGVSMIFTGTRHFRH